MRRVPVCTAAFLPFYYAEKLLYLKEGQTACNHFHWYKTEDIINGGGGNVLIRVYNSLQDEGIDCESNVTVHTDGRTYTVPAGTQIRLLSLQGVRVKDTTGAGDIFGGSAVWKLLQLVKNPEELNEAELTEIVRFACTAAGLSTTRSGGVSSVPEYDAVLQAM